jgi:hypothetical protein
MNNFLEFHETISEKINEEIEYLNCGGCGFFAYFMSKKLIMLGYQPKILVLERNDIEIEGKYKILKAIKNNQKVSIPKNSLSSAHFVVQCGNYVFDSEEIINIENNPLKLNEMLFGWRYIGEYTVEDMAIALYRDKPGWNNWYCRLENNGLLYKIIKETQYV